MSLDEEDEVEVLIDLVKVKVKNKGLKKGCVNIKMKFCDESEVVKFDDVVGIGMVKVEF